MNMPQIISMWDSTLNIVNSNSKAPINIPQNKSAIVHLPRLSDGINIDSIIKLIIFCHRIISGYRS